MRVMVVDGDFRTSLVLARSLQESGHQVIQYGSAPEAVRALLDASCDLCFLDARLPGVDSPFAIRVLREVAPDMPVILVGEETPAAEEAALRAGAALVVRTPAGADAVREVLGIFTRGDGDGQGGGGRGELSAGRASPPPQPGRGTG
ncbi:MAG TPA: response regulator [Candidatus Methylomirabilis sp.]|jgi:DNA-binding response OmpR family regulator|nr:response regulator [Candidatus Methylomirabilis sp.]